MISSAPPVTDLSFGPFVLDFQAGRLSRDGTPVALRPKAYALLVALACRPDVLVTKDELLDAVWGRRHITEGVIKSAIAELRTAMGDDPQLQQWIQTVPRRGYRFVGKPPNVRPEPVGTPPATPPAPHVDALPRGDIPYPASALLAREEELARLGMAVARHRLVTVTGPAGVGKTRLAMAFAHDQRQRWRDGVWLIELATLSSESTGIGELCALIALRLRLDPGSGTGTGALARGMQALNALLVLDNAEHLPHLVATAVSAMLGASPALKIVVTSQESLRIDGEQVQRLRPLSLPAIEDDGDADHLMSCGAVRLFVERASARLEGFVLAPQQQQAVASICRALDGLPLALELAAARVPMLGVHGVADMLARDGSGGGARFHLLSSGARSAALRQQTLHDALLWSHDLLNDVQKRVFRRLGVFAGGFTAEMAQRVCSDDTSDAWVALDALSALTDKCLVEALPLAVPVRLRLLESPRAFALRQLDARGDRAVTQGRHLDAMLERIKAADARWLTEPGLNWVDTYIADLDNLRAALRWAEASQRVPSLVDLAAHAAMLWCRAGLSDEGQHWCERARFHLDGQAHAGLDLAVATLAVYGNGPCASDTWTLADQAARAFERSDPVRAYFALYAGYQLRIRAQMPFDREAVLHQMQALEQAEWGMLLKRLRRAALGYHLRLAGDTDGYLRYCRNELELSGRLQAYAEKWTAAHGLMLAESDRGNLDAAIAAGESALREIRTAGRLRQYPGFLALWTTMAVERGTGDHLQDAVAEAITLLRATRNAWMMHLALAWMAHRGGRSADAARILGWHEAERSAGRAMGSGGYISRSTRALEAALSASLGRDGLDGWRDQGRGLDEDAVCRLALTSEASAM